MKDKMNVLADKSRYFTIITALFCQPEQDVISEEELYRELSGICQRLKPGSQSWVGELNEAASPGAAKLMIEYARLFIGPFKLPAPPYASCYLDTKELNGPVTNWVREFYLIAGLEFDYTIMDLPDHIAVECEFLAYVLSQNYLSLEKNEEDRAGLHEALYKSFLQEHHAMWFPDFAQKVMESSPGTFYDYLVKLHAQMLPLL